MILQPSFSIKTDKVTHDYGKFVIEPLEQGYGSTLGTALRRVLLTSLPGSAATSVSVDGLRHQFGTIKGVREDGVDLLLNLKKLRVKYSGDKPVRLTLSAKGSGTVTASQIEAPAGVEITNPELVIATLADAKTKLNIDIQIERGVGYSGAEERKTNKIGLIPLDADFTPVKRVNTKIEETRVGRLTNFDKLTLEVWTDGTVEPLTALTQAAEVLVNYFSRVSSPVQASNAVEPVQTILPRAATLSIEELGLPTRIANALSKAGYEAVSDILASEKSELAKVRNMGEKSIKVIEAALKEKGIDWES